VLAESISGWRKYKVLSSIDGKQNWLYAVLVKGSISLWEYFKQ
jgi:hypothetical protein